MNDLQETPWTYNWRPVFLNRRAYIPNSALKPGGKMAPAVLRALSTAKEPWPQEDEPAARTINVVPYRMPLIATSIRPNSDVVWAVHRNHRKYGRRGLNVSPFVRFPPGERPGTTLLTLCAADSPQGLVITQMYPGEVMAPPVCLAKQGELSESIDYWQTHGYVAAHNTILPGSAQTTPPRWWTKEC